MTMYIPEAQTTLVVVWALYVHSFGSEQTGMGVTGRVGHGGLVVGGVVSVGIALAGVITIGGDVALAVARNTTHGHPASAAVT